MGPAFQRQLNTFFALWLAPNAGLLFFWPLFVGVLLSVPFAVSRYSSITSAGALAAFWGVALLLVLVTGFCARWWAPFGWWAWGQRLTIPWLPASLLVLCFAYQAELERLIVRLLRTPARAAWLTAVLIALALPHVARASFVPMRSFNMHSRNIQTAPYRAARRRITVITAALKLSHGLTPRHCSMPIGFCCIRSFVCARWSMPDCSRSGDKSVSNSGEGAASDILAQQIAERALNV